MADPVGGYGSDYDLLVGMVVGGGQAYAVTTGQLDEPQLATGPNQAVAWSAYVSPTGTVMAFGSTTAALTLGYPGQWDRPELMTPYTGKANGMRDYCGRLARYLEPDPLGIDAGPNPYA